MQTGNNTEGGWEAAVLRHASGKCLVLVPGNPEQVMLQINSTNIYWVAANVPDIVLSVGNSIGHIQHSVGWCLGSDLYSLRSNLRKIKAGP